ncbi:MAG: hypothetical protein IPG48_14325 [Saprospiraceae bacterium]|nr:hypothetical protein [Saprospiraceae bacterium]
MANTTNSPGLPAATPSAMVHPMQISVLIYPSEPVLTAQQILVMQHLCFQR